MQGSFTLHELHSSKLHRIASRWVSNTYKEGHSSTSPDSLCPYSVTLTVKKLFLTFRWIFLHFSCAHCPLYCLRVLYKWDTTYIVRNVFVTLIKKDTLVLGNQMSRYMVNLIWDIDLSDTWNLTLNKDHYWYTQWKGKFTTKKIN